MRIFLAIIISVFSFLYLLPTGIAVGRKRSNTGSIFVLNFFLGWTLVGWVIALIWAVAEDAKKSLQVPVMPVTHSAGETAGQ